MQKKIASISKKKLGKRRLSRLKDFPKQADIFPLNTEELEQLRESIERLGLKHRIEILGDNSAGYDPNTIVSGHSRRKVLISLGYESVEVVIRSDLANATPEEIEQEFIAENLDRRQLSPLGRARCIKAIFVLERSGGKWAASQREQEQLRDRVGKRIRMSGRNAKRYLDVTEAPMSVQHAFDAQKVSLVVASRVGTASSVQKRRIDKLIQGGEDVVLAIKAVLGTRKATVPRSTIIARSLKNYEKVNDELDRVDLKDYRARFDGVDLAILKRTKALCERLMHACQQSLKQQEAIVCEVKRKRKRN